LLVTYGKSGFSPGTPVSSTNTTDRHDITEILLKVAFNTINPNPRKLRYRKMTNYKRRKSINGCLKYFFPEKNYMSRNNSRISMCVCSTVLYKRMNSLRNDVYNLFVNTHVWTKIYRLFYHGITLCIYIANEGRHVRIHK
jgi:hypothetical protein